jgi:hypothetical protein
MAALTHRDRRVLRLALTVALPFFAAAYGGRPAWRAYAERRDAIEQQRELLARERGVAQSGPSLDSALAASGATVRGELRTVVRSGARATAFSQLTERLRATARRSEVAILQVTEVGADSLGDGLQLLRLSIRSESDIGGLARFLRAVESDPLRIRTSRMFIERGAQGVPGADDGSTDGRNVLFMTATVEALAFIDDASARRRE